MGEYCYGKKHGESELFCGYFKECHVPKLDCTTLEDLMDCRFPVYCIGFYTEEPKCLRDDEDKNG